MGLIKANSRRSMQLPIPNRYQGDLRLAIWYRHGFSQAQRGFTPSEQWLHRLDEDKAVSQAYWAGHRDGEAVNS